MILNVFYRENRRNSYYFLWQSRLKFLCFFFGWWFRKYSLPSECITRSSAFLTSSRVSCSGSPSCLELRLSEVQFLGFTWPDLRQPVPLQWVQPGHVLAASLNSSSPPLWAGSTVRRGEKLISSVQSLSLVWLFATPWTTACQASLSITNSQSLLKLLSIESVMPSNHLILCHPLTLLPSIFLSIRVFSNESVLPIRWPKYWSFSFSISPSNEYSGLISLGWTGWMSLLSKGFSRVISNTTVQKHQLKKKRHQFFSAQLSL